MLESIKITAIVVVVVVVVVVIIIIISIIIIITIIIGAECTWWGVQMPGVAPTIQLWSTLQPSMSTMTRASGWWGFGM